MLKALVQMVNKLSNEDKVILDKVDEIIEVIKTSPNYQKYLL